MSEAMFNKRSWNRAMGPTLRTIGYFSAGFLIFFLIYYLSFVLGTLAGIADLIDTVFGFIGPLILIFYFVLCIFKVIDEEMVGNR